MDGLARWRTTSWLSTATSSIIRFRLGNDPSTFPAILEFLPGIQFGS